VLLTVLLGLGLRELSMASTAIPLAKRVIRGLRVSDARVAARRALSARTAAEVERGLNDLGEPIGSKRV
jgi:phosphoenolpyruvate-protein kinase (PTS system EI component)